MRKICVSGKMLADALVDLRGRRTVVAERLLQHDARDRRDQRVPRQRSAMRREQVRRRSRGRRRAPDLRCPRSTSREPSEVILGLWRRRARSPGARRTWPSFDVSKALPRCVSQAGAHLLQIVLALSSLRAAPMIATRRRIWPRAAAPIQRRQELAHRQVAGAAEQDEIELGSDCMQILHAGMTVRATLTRLRRKPCAVNCCDASSRTPVPFCRRCHVRPPTH